jgi:hypothetical protein
MPTTFQINTQCKQGPFEDPPSQSGLIHVVIRGDKCPTAISFSYSLELRFFVCVLGFVVVVVGTAAVVG